ncbi:uncharacterized protein LOC114968381 isoform X3 [Acropora millepora]|uniref:uncharacterized protein LOC114968381 isoform X3 n=1 Tax=Acropora millepora TaxID=45264 RepID=UPI001CF2D807|nr:uncharacterized protein LOC114968381 isoform X3 [Acropora millepora]
MASAQFVETSVTNNSPSKHSNHPDDRFQSRQDYKDLLDVMQLDDGSSEGSSSSDEDIDFLFLEAAFPEPRLLGPRLNIEDISEIDCEQMFSL